MKSSINIPTPVAVAPTFPSLWTGDKGNIWLRTSEKSGVVVGTIDGASKPKDVGYSSDKLVPARFTKFDGEITLAN